MTTVTADDIQVLAQSTDEDPVLVLVDDDIRVMAARDAPPASPGRVIYTRADLVDESGEEVTDVEAATLAAGLTAQLTTSR
jgi:hypothetical protein